MDILAEQPPNWKPIELSAWTQSNSCPISPATQSMVDLPTVHLGKFKEVNAGKYTP